MDALGFAIHKSELQGFIGIAPRKPKPHQRAAISESGLMMNMRGMTRCLSGTGDFEDARIKVCLLDLWHSISRGAIPAIANRFGEMALFLPLKGVMKNKGALIAQPSRILLRESGERENEQAGKDRKRLSHGKRTLRKLLIHHVDFVPEII